MTFTDDYFEDEIRDGFHISSMMKRAWAAQLEVLGEIQRVCETLEIQYFADFGTLLGCVRHHGFIPWDDDIDICMLRSDYMQFLDRAPEILDTWYEVKSVYNDPTDDIVKARVINGRHINFEKNFLSKFHGCPYVVGIDIFPVDNVPDNDKEYKDMVTALEFLLRVEASIPEAAPYDSDTIDLIHQIEYNFGVEINYNNRLRHEIKKVYDIVCARYMEKTTKDVGCMMALGAGWKGYRYAREGYQSYIMMPFENMTILVPKCYQEVLTSIYGNDYMIPKNIGASHTYPFYKEQKQGLKEVMENEFQIQLTDEQMDMLIEQKVSEVWQK